jgi:NAD(P)-dependent dehydrogenase (short-subunit alcohol dehydrogenase family)
MSSIGARVLDRLIRQSTSVMFREMTLLHGKVAIVTGAGAGIGREHALQLAKAGARVVVNDIGGNSADAVVEEIATRGGEAVPSYDSVASFEGAQRIVWTALNRFGQIDIVVNNAGILRDRTLLNLSEEDFDAVIGVHLKGTFLVTQAAARQMKLLGHGGRIINTTSVSGLIGNFGQTNYAAAKAGIYGMTRVWSIELAKIHVTVNAIAPVALTRMTEGLPSMQHKSEEQLGPQHVAPLAVFLASDLAKDITGRVFGVEGTKLFEYAMTTSPGVTKESAWTPLEISERLSEISLSQTIPPRDRNR